jgi:hypothetical protein
MLAVLRLALVRFPRPTGPNAQLPFGAGASSSSSSSRSTMPPGAVSLRTGFPLGNPFRVASTPPQKASNGPSTRSGPPRGQRPPSPSGERILHDVSRGTCRGLIPARRPAACDGTSPSPTSTVPRRHGGDPSARPRTTGAHRLRAPAGKRSVGAKHRPRLKPGPDAIHLVQAGGVAHDVDIHRAHVPRPTETSAPARRLTSWGPSPRSAYGRRFGPALGRNPDDRLISDLTSRAERPVSRETPQGDAQWRRSEHDARARLPDGSPPSVSRGTRNVWSLARHLLWPDIVVPRGTEGTPSGTDRHRLLGSDRRPPSGGRRTDPRARLVRLGLQGASAGTLPPSPGRPPPAPLLSAKTSCRPTTQRRTSGERGPDPGARTGPAGTGRPLPRPSPSCQRHCLRHASRSRHAIPTDEAPPGRHRRTAVVSVDARGGIDPGPMHPVCGLNRRLVHRSPSPSSSRRSVHRTAASRADPHSGQVRFGGVDSPTVLREGRDGSTHPRHRKRCGRRSCCAPTGRRDRNTMLAPGSRGRTPTTLPVTTPSQDALVVRGSCPRGWTDRVQTTPASGVRRNVARVRGRRSTWNETEVQRSGSGPPCPWGRCRSSRTAPSIRRTPDWQARGVDQFAMEPSARSDRWR